MNTTHTGAIVTPMSDLAARGRALAEALAQRPELSKATLARKADVSRQTIYEVLEGKAAEKTVRAVELALAEWDENPDDRDSHPESVVLRPDAGAVVEVEMQGVVGVGRVFVRAPVGDKAALTQAVQAVMDAARGDDDPGTSASVPPHP